MASGAGGQISQGDRIVAVMGLTGAGKSTFIEHATRQLGNGGTVSHSWRSHTEDFQSAKVTHPNYKHPIVFVDTPGFDHTSKSDVEILAMITEWLVRIHDENAKLATILYLHRISDNRMSGSAMKNLRLFSSICGKDAMPHVVIVSTMWSRVRKEEGIEREEILKREVWDNILGEGFSVKRFEDTYESAWNIVGSSMKVPGAPLLIQEEMGDAGKSLNNTQAGIRLNETGENVPKGLLTHIRKGFSRLFKWDRDH